MNTPIVQVQDLCRSYCDVKALDRVNLTLEQDKIYGTTSNRCTPLGLRHFSTKTGAMTWH